MNKTMCTDLETEKTNGAGKRFHDRELPLPTLNPIKVLINQDINNTRKFMIKSKIWQTTRFQEVGVPIKWSHWTNFSPWGSQSESRCCLIEKSCVRVEYAERKWIKYVINYLNYHRINKNNRRSVIGCAYSLYTSKIFREQFVCFTVEYLFHWASSCSILESQDLRTQYECVC